MAYKNWNTIRMRYIGDAVYEQRQQTIRDAAILTTSYVDSDYVDCAGSNQVAVFFDYAKGSLTSLEYQVWWSLDGTTWHQEVSELVAVGTTTITLQNSTYAGSEKFYAAFPVFGRYFKLMVKGTGTATGSSLKMDVIGRY